MNYFKPYIFIILVSGIFLMLTSCSHSQSPVETVIDDQQKPIAIAECNSNQSVLAVYDAVIDPVAETFTVTPSERNAQYHYPLTRLYPDVLQITRWGFTPNFWADIKISHPLPNSGIDAFDPRVIAILPANPGVSMSYPNFQVLANNSVVLNPDGYTKLYDNLGGSIPGNTNPFLAYFKNVEYRRWFSSGTGYTSDTRRWDMDINGFGGPMVFKLVVDVSLNYPNPPQQIVDNAPEPVEINASIGQGLSANGGSAEINVTLLDWQGRSGIGGVQIETPALFDGTVNLSFSAPGPNSNEYVFSGTIINSLSAPIGRYKALASSWDQVTGTYIYNEFSIMVSGGYLEWAKSAACAGGSYSYGITTLTNDSTVVSGKFVSSVTFGPGEPNETIITSAGDWDIFVARYNPDGTLVWAKRAGGRDFDESRAIKSLSDNSTVIIGTFSRSATFGPGEINETVLESSGELDIFIAKYNPDGSLAWAKSAGGSSYDQGYGITVISNNSIVVTGCFRESAVFGRGEPNESTLISNGSDNLFIAMYNPDGMIGWAKKAEGPSFVFGYSLIGLSDNSSVVTGRYFDSAIFGIDEPNQTMLTSVGEGDIFIARYNPDGSLMWAKSAGGGGVDYGNGITSLTDDSSVVTGSFRETAIFGPGEPGEKALNSSGNDDIFLARFNPDGTLAWARSAGGEMFDFGFGIIALSDNSTVLTGWFEDSATFGKSEPNETVLVEPWGSYSDIFIARYNTDGTLAWARRAGGDSWDIGQGVTSLSDNSTVVTGEFSISATFGQDETNQTVLIAESPYPYSDIFIARFAP